VDSYGRKNTSNRNSEKIALDDMKELESELESLIQALFEEVGVSFSPFLG